MWEAVVNSFDSCCQWVAIFLRSLFTSTGQLKELVNLAVIGIAIFVFLIGLKFINVIRR